MQQTYLIVLFCTYLGKTKQDDVKGYVTKEDDVKVAFVTMVSKAIYIIMMLLIA
jgi:hypothetical protein